MLFGSRIPRVEDADLLAGRGRFLDDIEPPGTLHLAVRRSDVAHGIITDIDTSRAETHRGVQVFNAHDLSHLRWQQVLANMPLRPALAERVVRYQGEPMAVAVARDRAAAMDAVGDIWIDYRDLPVLVDVHAAMAPEAAPLYDELDSNVVYRSGGGVIDGLFDGAAVVVERTFSNHRIAPGMLEPRGILAVPRDGDRLTVYCSHQSPHRFRDLLASTLGMDARDLRVVVPDVGGGFGSKASFYPEYPIVADLARRLGRPVKFVETRSENLAVSAHGRDQITSVAIGAKTDGEIVGLRFRAIGNMGAAVDNQRWCLHATEQMVSGCYRIPRIEREILGVLTNTAPVGAFRGAGRPEAAYAIERSIDHLARRLDLDAADVRRRNLIETDAFPYETGVGSTYDSGGYREALETALDRLGYDTVRAEQARRTEGVLIGVGVASYVELAGAGQEFGEVSLSDSGIVTVKTGTSPHGQGHRTTWAQIAADELGVRVEAVEVVHGDTDAVPRGGGTSGSRSAVLGGTAVGLAARLVADRLRDLAAERLEAATGDIRLEGGRAVVVGTDVGVPIRALVDGELTESADFVTPGLTYPFGVHGCIVEIDPDTGEVSVRSFIAVDDCGRVINPIITEGQVHGGIAQGVGHALFEGVLFDDNGNLMTGNLTSYRIPAISDVLPIESVRTETPTPNNPLGVKGVGEAGATGSTPAVANAVMDALARLGVDEDDISMPYTPAKVWSAMRRVSE
ncbi:MAG: xanthine dehydrogenase family protein molybdopterin-binding subunit [Acidimicrobiia bacterium]|nr:xanthine dehydrogenase family protein molybdopterin-binding subunit [Acidimicrobiia bacterium]